MHGRSIGAVLPLATNGWGYAQLGNRSY